MKPLPLERLEQAYQTALSGLLAERHPDGYWAGELSTSALATATAISALAVVQKQSGTEDYQELIDTGLTWLVTHQNSDGGWGDTVKSFSNISTTMLCRAALHLTGGAQSCADTLRRAETWLFERYGKTSAELAEAVRQRYGKDRTFAVPILATCAVAGLMPWREVPPLPFELACLPQSWFRFLRLHVVSYALPALIAIGQLVHQHRPSWNPITRLVRALSRKRSLRVLERIQPSNGGFLEATPLTSFVTLSLAACGLADHPVARKGADFIVNSVRPDGSWPIDTNLSTWLTTLAVTALDVAGEIDALGRKDTLLSWLLKQQFLERHPYTGAPPGGWAWTDLPGGVPDGDDSPGALLAIRHVVGPDAANAIAEFMSRVYGSANLIDLTVTPKIWARKGEVGQPAFHVICGLGWVRDLQNRDGGWPTFCRGWGSLPFDRSGGDLSAHALRALRAWLQPSVACRVLDVLDESLNLGIHIPTPRKFDEVSQRGLAYLARKQRRNGSWLPLWFGNQHAPDEQNPTYGTARVLAAYRDLYMMDTEPARRGIAWLVANQNEDGGWGGCKGCPSSMEETALAVEILVDAMPPGDESVNKGLVWLVQQVEAGGLYNPTPIGFYFAKLWYFEKLYPMIFTVAALGRARRKLAAPTSS